MLQRNSKGQMLLDKVFEYLELIEKDYFGLQFVEHTPSERLVVCHSNDSLLGDDVWSIY